MNTIDTNNVPEHLQGFEAIKQNARVLLDSALQEQGIALLADQIYINSINDHAERLVTHSESLTVLVANAVLHNEPPVLTADFSGVFSVAYSFEDAHRIDGEDISIETFATIIDAVYDQLIG